MSTFTNARFIHYNNNNNKSRVQTPHNVQSLFTFHPSVEFSLSRPGLPQLYSPDRCSMRKKSLNVFHAWSERCLKSDHCCEHEAKLGNTLSFCTYHHYNPS